MRMACGCITTYAQVQQEEKSGHSHVNAIYKNKNKKFVLNSKKLKKKNRDREICGWEGQQHLGDSQCLLSGG